MKLTQRSFNLRKVSIDFLEKMPQKGHSKNGGSRIERNRRIGKIENIVPTIDIYEIISRYEFNFDGHQALFVFSTRFDLVLEDDSLEDVEKKFQLDENNAIINSIITPQEQYCIKKILNDAGLSISSGFGDGEEFII